MSEPTAAERQLLDAIDLQADSRIVNEFYWRDLIGKVKGEARQPLLDAQVTEVIEATLQAVYEAGFEIGEDDGDLYERLVVKARANVKPAALAATSPEVFDEDTAPRGSIPWGLATTSPEGSEADAD